MVVRKRKSPSGKEYKEISKKARPDKQQNELNSSTEKYPEQCEDGKILMSNDDESPSTSFAYDKQKKNANFKPYKIPNAKFDCVILDCEVQQDEPYCDSSTTRVKFPIKLMLKFELSMDTHANRTYSEGSRSPCYSKISISPYQKFDKLYSKSSLSPSQSVTGNLLEHTSLSYGPCSEPNEKDQSDDDRDYLIEDSSNPTSVNVQHMQENHDDNDVEVSTHEDSMNESELYDDQIMEKDQSEDDRDYLIEDSNNPTSVNVQYDDNDFDQISTQEDSVNESELYDDQIMQEEFDESKTCSRCFQPFLAMYGLTIYCKDCADAHHIVSTIELSPTELKLYKFHQKNKWYPSRDNFCTTLSHVLT